MYVDSPRLVSRRHRATATASCVLPVPRGPVRMKIAPVPRCSMILSNFARHSAWFPFMAWERFPACRRGKLFIPQSFNSIRCRSTSSTISERIRDRYSPSRERLDLILEMAYSIFPFIVLALIIRLDFGRLIRGEKKLATKFRSCERYIPPL